MPEDIKITIFIAQKENNLQTRIPYSAKLSSKRTDKVTIYSKEQKLKKPLIKGYCEEHHRGGKKYDPRWMDRNAIRNGQKCKKK